MDRPDSLGYTATIRELADEATDIALCGVRILLTGETGVGKQTLARLIHRRTRHATAPLVVLDCSELSDSTFESGWLDAIDMTGPHTATTHHALRSATGATILVRSLEKMTSRKQGALFGYLDARHRAAATTNGQTSSAVDVRLITSGDDATLLGAVETGTFRQDLFYRLNTVHLRVPPLRERFAEVHLLFDRFVREFSNARQCAVPSIAAETRQALTSYSWPGNVRELKEVASRLVTKSSQVRPDGPMIPGQLQFESGPAKRSAHVLPDLPIIGTSRPRVVARPRSVQ
jgi:DNA-binding NtrC family response regulator